MIQEIMALFSQITQMNIVLIFGLLLIFVVIAYKLLKILMKAVLFGILGALFPFVSGYVGIQIATSISNILWFALLGMVAYVMYAMMSGGVKTMKMITSPFRALFKKKEKKTIIIHEQLPSERQKKR